MTDRTFVFADCQNQTFPAQRFALPLNEAPLKLQSTNRALPVIICLAAVEEGKMFARLSMIFSWNIQAILAISVFNRKFLVPLPGCESDKISTGHVLQEFETRSITLCGVLCAKNNFCTSVNIVGQNTCQLIWMNYWDHATQSCLNLTASPGSKYLTRVCRYLIDKNFSAKLQLSCLDSDLRHK